MIREVFVMKKFLVTFALAMLLLSSSVFASDAKTLLNSAPLNPKLTGFSPCDEIVQEVLSEIITDEMTTYEKVKTCYDWLIENCSYGGGIMHIYDIAQWREHQGAMRAQEMLKNRVGVCNDYSCAFAALTRAIGLNCYTVSGLTAKASGGMTGHMWTVIKINGTEYVFDPQIDDNIAKGGAIGYYRFCVTYEETPDSYGNYRPDNNFKPFDGGDNI